ncbi:MAG: c-type cytochrome [Bacteroidetes bacterium]|nr:c-type cytochrome [Bacteroidota bacterium]
MSRTSHNSNIPIPTRLAALCFIALTLFSSCKPDPDFEAKPAKNTAADISFNMPQGWPAPYYSFANNKLTNEGFALGRKLFYDPRLSKDNTISCGSCHQQAGAFIQIGHQFSHGVGDINGTRNSPPLFNLAWSTSFFWDGGVNNLESQPINPIQNPIEMDESIGEVVAELQGDDTYISMFKAAFGDGTINSQRIFKALAQFMGVMVSADSRFDKYKRNETGATLTAQELNGYEVYKANCSRCHTEPLFTDYNFRNNGLAPDTYINDSGRAHITRAMQDMYQFKTPSLRNLGYTAPYMHDGRFQALDEVLDHYAKGIHKSPTLDSSLVNGIQLSSQQRADLLAFLNTLNDESFVKNSIYAEVK